MCSAPRSHSHFLPTAFDVFRSLARKDTNPRNTAILSHRFYTDLIYPLVGMVAILTVAVFLYFFAKLEPERESKRARPPLNIQGSTEDMENERLPLIQSSPSNRSSAPGSSRTATRS